MGKTKFIRATGYALVGNTGGPASSLAPGERVPFNEDSASHKAIAAEIESGANTTLELVDIDVSAEKDAEAEREKLLEQADQIAAEAAQEQVRQEQGVAGEGTYNPEENSVVDVMEYLKQASPEEAARVQELEANSSRDSKQVAGFVPKEEPATETPGTEGGQ